MVHTAINPEYTIPGCLQEYYPFWDKITKSEQESLISCSTIQSYHKNDFIYSRDEDCLGILLVLEGQLRIYIQSEENREVTLLRLGPGEVCTLSASCMIREINFDIEIEAEEDSRILTTNVCCFHKLMEQNIYVENYFYKQTVESFSDIMWALSQILFSSFDKRLASYLEDERIRTGSPVLKTTHEQIARNMGSAREVVSRMLKYFEKEGIVTLSRGTVTLTDTAKLKSYFSSSE